ncbi:MAG: hypothetical protein JSS27_11770 [Planctomycetes bacterium]|nr:hypothetical protein [Planctomycetota bacterium]
MSEATFFTRECPTCGRHLHIRVEYLGREVVCQHCRGRFTATDPDGTATEPSASAMAMLQRVDELIDLAEQRRDLPR